MTDQRQSHQVESRQITAAPKLVTTVISDGWNGSSPISKEVADHGKYRQHHLVVSTKASSLAASNITVRGRPTGSRRFVEVATTAESVAMTTNGILFQFQGFYDSFRLTASAEFGNDVQVTLTSHPGEAGPRVASDLVTGGDGAAVSSLLPGHELLAGHYVCLMPSNPGGAGNYEIHGLPINSSAYVLLGTLDISDHGKCLATQGGFRGFLVNPVTEIATGDLDVRVISYDPDDSLPLTDHGSLTGLTDDDHTQYLNNARGDARYLELDGTGTMTGDLNMGGFDITNFAQIVEHGNGIWAGYSLSDSVLLARSGQDDQAVTLTNINAVLSHGNLTGLTADDHTQYLLVAGTRAMTGDLDLGANNITDIAELRMDAAAPTLTAINVADGVAFFDDSDANSAIKFGRFPVIVEDRFNTAVTGPTTTSYVDLYSFSIPADTMLDNSILHLELGGVFQNGAGLAKTVDWRVQLDGTTRAEDGGISIAVSAGTYGAWKADVWLVCANSATNKWIAFTVDMGRNGTPTTGVGTFAQTSAGRIIASGSGTFAGTNNNTAQVLKVAAQWSAATGLLDGLYGMLTHYPAS